MTNYLTATKHAERISMPETHLIARAFVPTRVTDPSFLTIPPFMAGWQGTDQIAQGARIVDVDGCSVTDFQKLSTRLGPPSCSPPV
ncbi:MAG TPA: hypothetical protein VIT20_11615 [Propionibacteriaceae bacterium]